MRGFMALYVMKAAIPCNTTDMPIESARRAIAGTLTPRNKDTKVKRSKTALSPTMNKNGIAH